MGWVVVSYVTGNGGKCGLGCLAVVGCVTSKSHVACVSGTDLLRQLHVLPHREKWQIKLAVSSSILTAGPPVLALTL